MHRLAKGIAAAIFYFSPSMAKVFIAVLVLLSAGMALLAINILLRKNGTFRSQDVGASKAMRDRGIHCARTQDKLAQKDMGSIKDMMK